MIPVADPNAPFKDLIYPADKRSDGQDAGGASQADCGCIWIRLAVAIANGIAALAGRLRRLMASRASA